MAFPEYLAARGRKVAQLALLTALSACVGSPHVASELDHKSAPLAACEQGECAQAGYPLPWRANYHADMSLPACYRLRDAWLELDDHEQAPDTHHSLMTEFKPAPGVTTAPVRTGIVRFGFDVPFFKPGVNRFVLHALAARGGVTETLHTLAFQLDYNLPARLGLGSDGSLQLPAAHFTRSMRDCSGLLCKDADGDGLNDLWENVALQQLRPRLLLDREDALFRRRSDSVRVLSSAIPLQHGGREFVLFASVIAFTRDYGYRGWFDHAGDTEAFGMLYRVETDGALRWVASAAKGHACLTCGPRYAFHRQDFGADGVPLLYVEKDKHGVWQNGHECRAHAAFSCGADRSLRPAATNIGDPSPDGSRGLIDALDGIALAGTFGELAGVFPGDAIWTAARSRVPGRFCGGVAGCNRTNSANQPGAVIGQLVELLAARAH